MHVIRVKAQQPRAIFQAIDFSVLGLLIALIRVGIPKIASAIIAKIEVDHGSECEIYKITQPKPIYKKRQSFERITKFLVKKAEKNINVQP